MSPEERIHKNLLLIQEKIFTIQETAGLNHPVTIVGVTKTHSPVIVKSAIQAGLSNIGENKVQEAVDKFNSIAISNKTTKHMIGHLQSNKVNKALKTFDRIDSIDSNKLADIINNKAQKAKKRITALLEINTSEEEQKHGFIPEPTDKILSCFEKDNLYIEGLMTIGPFTDNEKKIRDSFSCLRKLMDKLNGQLPPGKPKMSELSMGMSGDYQIGIEEGSTMVRIGTLLFGPRHA